VDCLDQNLKPDLLRAVISEKTLSLIPESEWPIYYTEKDMLTSMIGQT
jgi:hypothetical protein